MFGLSGSRLHTLFLNGSLQRQSVFSFCIFIFWLYKRLHVILKSTIRADSGDLRVLLECRKSGSVPQVQRVLCEEALLSIRKFTLNITNIT